jgi:hypothetical protein
MFVCGTFICHAYKLPLPFLWKDKIAVKGVYEAYARNNAVCFFRE